jgi:hypothetical protein
METHLKDAAGVWDSDSGAFISSKHQRLAEILHDYNPYFSLVWIPPENRDATDTKPFAILNSSPSRPQHIIRYLSEAEMNEPEKIMSWVFEGDLDRNNPQTVFARIEARDRAAKLFELKAKQEEAEAREDFAGFVFGSRSPNTFRHNGQTYRK